MTTSQGSSTTSQQSQTTSNPWGPSIHLLESQLGKIGGVSTDVTGNQSNAAGALIDAASGIPNLAPFAQGSAGSLLSGMPNVNNLLAGNYGATAGALGANYGAASDFLHQNYNDANKILGSNYNTLAQNLSPFFNSNFTNISQNPQVQAQLQTIRDQVTNDVNGQFAGAGRDLSGMNQQALARGLAQGEAPVLLDEYNKLLGAQQNAAGMLANAGQGYGQTLGGLGATTGSAIGGLGLGSAETLGNLGVNTGAGFDKNAVAGLGAAQSVPGLQLAGPQAQLAAANTQYGLPLANIAGQEGLTIPIAGLGGQVNSSGTSTTNTTATPSLMSSIGSGLGLFTGFGGWSSPLQGIGALGNTLSSFGAGLAGMGPFLTGL